MKTLLSVIVLLISINIAQAGGCYNKVVSLQDYNTNFVAVKQFTAYPSFAVFAPVTFINQYPTAIAVQTAYPVGQQYIPVAIPQQYQQYQNFGCGQQLYPAGVSPYTTFSPQIKTGY